MAGPQLSALARLAKRNAFAEFEEGSDAPRTSAVPTAVRGFARGSLGSMGSTTLKSRNPDAQLNEERSIFHAMMGS